MPPIPTSESAREREVFRYFQPSTIRHDNGDIGPQPVPESSQDRALTAFAQLGCLRMNTKRAMISFVDRKYEYIAAEATRTLSLQSDKVHDDYDQLLVGCRTIPREDGICSVAVERFTNRLLQKDSWGNNLEPIAMVVDDLLQDEQFAKKKFTVAESKLHFYASVALCSSRGFVIGAFSVIDDASRPGITPVEEQFLKDMAHTVMEHLETVSAKRKQSRAENMIKGMGLFIEGKSSLREWWLHSGHRQIGRQTRDGAQEGLSLEQQADAEFGVVPSSPLKDRPGKLSYEILETQPQKMSSTTRKDSADVVNTHQRNRPFPSRKSSSTSTLTSNVFSARSEIATRESTLTPETTESGTASKPGSDQESTSDSPVNDGMKGTPLQQFHFLKDIGDVFSRASNLLREATGVEGVVFFEGSIGNAGGGSNPKAPTAFQRETENWTTSSSEDEQRLANLRNADNARPAPAESSNKPNNITSVGVDVDKNCNVLGYSTRTQSSLLSDITQNSKLSMPEKFLRKLLKRYPHGKIFNFDEDGSISSSEDDFGNMAVSGVSSVGGSGRQSPRGRHRETKRRLKIMEAETILKILPGARNVAFMPMWDSHKEKWFAASLSWTSDPTRVFDVEEDLTYLAAFGNSIMVEVSRINALMSDQRKSDFISSVSHELRSPLHGVLASVEFLQDTQMNAFQDDMVSSIDTCGKALLDIINHVLDFTKINTFNRARRASKKRNETGPKTLKISPMPRIFPEDSHMPDINLSVITEEVMESILVGRRYMQSSAVGGSDREICINEISTPPTGEAKSDSPVMVLLDIDWQSNWSFEIQPGAWRRIIMNLVSNAMKYTSQGLVYVSLRSEALVPSKKSQRPQSMISLIIEDSGKGMSDDFLQNHLFQPFSQEDSLTTGTGLGLSIIRQIVDGVGGSIDINSEQDTGTEVTISLTLDQPSSRSGPKSKREELIMSVREKSQSLKVCLVAFDVYPNLSDAPDGILSVYAKRMLLLKSSITRMLIHWFGAVVVFAQNPDQGTADIYIAVEDDAQYWRPTSTYFPSSPLPGNSGGKPLILLRSRPSSVSKMVSDNGRCVVYTPQPCGPYAMAKALSICIGNLQSIDPNFKNDSYSIEKDLFAQEMVQATNNDSVSAADNFSLASLHLNPGDRMHRPQSKYSSNPQVLLVEDNEINLKLLIAYMQKLNINFKTAVNGLLALKSYQKMDPLYDIILMDISMPVMDGISAAREIRIFEQQRSLKPSKIIALTGAASASSQKDAYSSGIDLFLTKPVPMKELKRLLDR